MARLQIDVISQPGVTLDVIAPEYHYDEEACGLTREDFYEKKHKCLWLLHGMGNDSSEWMRFSMIEVFAREKNIFVVCPSARRGFYTDYPAGDQWETRIMTDIWDYVHKLFPMVSDKPEDNFVAGISMGGYGAMRYGLCHPDKFSLVGSLSAGLNVPQRFAAGENVSGFLEYAFGPADTVIGSDADLYVKAKELKESGKPLPRMYMACGTQDWEHEPNKAFYEYLTGLGFETSWDEADYSHEWRFWNQQIEKFLAVAVPDVMIVHKRRIIMEER